ncbi:nitroreductase family protein [Chryseolinea lacunae]|uniref:Nitroreductase family protein n=1 Tax=Chryseolinea lacunae TaxID=2801331 RepID=A0ABS1KTP4_9BACT|nr:nitroreductase family protein [Chryseolinea lacunae]MBL0742072.1 nitroreductase family protein [Chryseolinea lacunae]
MQKSHHVEHPISELIKNRKSPRAFSRQPIDADRIRSLFEATRWAPSSTNEQPWVYVYATHDQTELWDKLFSCLNESNKVWAKGAPLLILSLARKNFTRYPGANAHAMYDLGGANSFLSLQAVELGMQVRQMAGFSYEKTIEQLNIPDTYEVGVFMAVGYPGDPETLPEKLKLREMAPRERFLQNEFVMNHIF